jgi:tetratricopeptide (TPR) repeat protein
VFGLGVLLYELLGGSPPFVPGRSPSLYRLNPQVGQGLSDLVARALAARPEQRHATAAALAVDLRRHLHDQPLLSVPNRSLAERWRKWRRRNPSALRSWLLGISVLLATLAAGLALWLYVDHHIDEGRDALRDGRQRAQAGEHEEAGKLFRRGLEHLDRLPFRLELADQLRRESARADVAWRQTRRGKLRDDLHHLAEQVRGLYGVDLSPAAREPLEERCRQLWEQRDALVEELDIRANPTAIADLLDVALLWADWQARRPEAGPSRALVLLAEAEALFGPRAILDFERRRFRSESPLRPPAGEAGTAWEHVALARGCLKAGLLVNAEEHLERAIALRPDDHWSHFLLGLCAYRRGRYQDAVTEFTFCLGAAPNDAVCSYNRGLAYHALKDHRRALADYDRAVQASPSFAPAWQNRGLLHHAEKRHAQARADLREALRLGAPPAAIHLNLALVALAEDDRAAARTHLNRVLEEEPNHGEARSLLNSLKDRR